MRAKNYFYTLIFIVVSGCSYVTSPVGEWKLHIIKNGKLENVLTPKTIIGINDNGTFSCVAIEKGKTERNKGKWKQINSTIIFTDTTGSYKMIMDGKNHLFLEKQPFKSHGIEFVYIKSNPK